MQIQLLKVGGKIVEEPHTLTSFLQNFAALDGAKILIHGGGRTATTIAARLGIESNMIGGRRVTDAAMRDVVTMVYGGLINKNIVAQMQSLGMNALGLTGADLNIIRSRKRAVKDIDYGFVGDIEQVQAKPLLTLLQQGVVPIIAPLTHDGKGQILNTNADTIAAAAAIALAKEGRHKVTLTYCFEKAGVLADPTEEASVIARLTPSLYADYKAKGKIADGMLPKLDNAFAALNAGVSEVRITAADKLQDGTLLLLK